VQPASQGGKYRKFLEKKVSISLLQPIAEKNILLIKKLV